MLTEDADGSLYGATQNGGESDRGGIFRLSFNGPPQITAQPSSPTVYVGDKVVFSVAVTGARPFTYQWRRNGTNLLEGGNVFGSTNRTLGLANVSLADAASYTVSVSNALGSVTSATARLTVVHPPVFLSAVRSNCTLALTYSTMPGQRYRLQCQADATGTNWSYLGSSIFPTSNSVTAYDNACTNLRRFYRVVLFPQLN